MVLVGLRLPYTPVIVGCPCFARRAEDEEVATGAVDPNSTTLHTALTVGIVASAIIMYLVIQV